MVQTEIIGALRVDDRSVNVYGTILGWRYVKDSEGKPDKNRQEIFVREGVSLELRIFHSEGGYDSQGIIDSREVGKAWMGLTGPERLIEVRTEELTPGSVDSFVQSRSDLLTVLGNPGVHEILLSPHVPSFLPHAA